MHFQGDYNDHRPKGGAEKRIHWRRHENLSRVSIDHDHGDIMNRKYSIDAQSDTRADMQLNQTERRKRNRDETQPELEKEYYISQEIKRTAQRKGRQPPILSNIAYNQIDQRKGQDKEAQVIKSFLQHQRSTQRNKFSWHEFTEIAIRTQEP